MMELYLAAPLFSEAERKWNESFANGLMEAIVNRNLIATKIHLPQQFCGKVFIPFSYETAEKIYHKCLTNLERSNVVIAILNGAQVDDGTAFEVGYARATGIPIIGIRSDPRPGEWNGCNIMLSIGCSKTYTYWESIDYNAVIDIIIMAARKELS